MKGIISLFVIFLLCLGACWLIASFYPLREETQLAEEISESLQAELRLAGRQADQLLKVNSDDEAWGKSSFSFFLIKDERLVAWSKNDFIPRLSEFKGDFKYKFIQLEKGSFVLKKWEKENGFFLILLLPLDYNYGIANDYLKPVRNTRIIASGLELETAIGSGTCVQISDQDCLFKIRYRTNVQDLNSFRNILLVILIILLALCLILLVLRLVRRYFDFYYYEFSFVVLTFLLISVRILMVKNNFPGRLISIPLFDPTYYASSSYNASLGDMVINSTVVLFLCLFLYANYPKFKIIKATVNIKSWKSIIATSCCFLVCYLSLLFPYLFVESIYHNSALSLEITDSLSFNLLRISAFVSLLMGCLCAYLFIHVFFRLAVFMLKKSFSKFVVSFSIGSFLFLAFFIYDQKDYWITFWVGIVFFIVLHFSKIVHHHKGITFKTYLYFLVVIIAFSVECSLGVFQFNQEKKINSQFKFGNNYLVEQDILAEFLLTESAKNIRTDSTILVSFDSLTDNGSIQARIRQLYLNSYFERYDVAVHSYNADGLPREINSTLDFKRDIIKYSDNLHQSLFDGTYFINDLVSDTLQRYLSIIPITNDGVLLKGYVVLDLILKKIIPETVFPEMLVDNRYGQYLKNKDFSYALLADGKIGNSFGEFNYKKLFDPKWLGQVDLYNVGVVKDGYRHVAIEYQTNRIAVITAPIYSLAYIVINFSFFVALGLMVILIHLLVIWIVSWLRGSQINYASRIQLYVYLAFFVPLFLVSLTTLRLIIISSQNQKQQDYLSNAKILEKRISPILAEYQRQGKSYMPFLEEKLIDMAHIANLDASIYDNNGQLVVSSEPLIFENQLLSTLINRSAWHELRVNQENHFVSSETIGTLSYHSVYWAIKSSSTGEVIGILSIPFFESAYSLERTEINVVSAILGVFSIAFILFSLLSYFVISGLISPLKFLTNSLRKISLTGINTPIVWKAKDEIGIMANEYNRMLLNLEESKSALQRNQKDIAWREIAQQVAHEIKNPLTPMKLTLQQMELRFKTGDGSGAVTQKSVDVLLKQVEILNDIASSFSAYAKMPAPQIGEIDLNELLRKTIDFFAHKDDVEITLQDAGRINVLGDEAILVRAFSNIVLNGIQAKRNSHPVKIDISFAIQSETCVVSIRDNGVGIPEELKGKIFSPHFTTKAAGSGLGLAIVKQTLEICGGSIWFETEDQIGTVFLVQLPLVINHI